MPILLRNSYKSNNQKIVPLIPLRKGIVFPNTEAVLSFERSRSIRAIKAAFTSNHLVCFVSQKDQTINEPTLADTYKVGTLALVERILRNNGEVDALVKGISRVQIGNVVSKDPFLLANVSEIPDHFINSDEIRALVKYLTSQLKKAVNLGKTVEFLIFMRLMSDAQPPELADQVANILDLSTAEKQKILEIPDVKMRLEKVTELLTREIKILEIENQINSQTQKKFDKSMRETILRERLKTIQQELGDKEEDKETKEYRKKIKDAQMPKEVEAKAIEELDRFTKMHSFNPEAGYIRTYLDWLVEMPWSKRTTNNVSLKKAEKVLEEDHYGLKEVKERILEYLAVMKLKADKKQKQKGPTILCFVGPPGVGKTSMGQSIARALGRKFMRMSLGGIRDEAEIRGHRRTYVGALPGRIIQGIKNVGTKNPVFMLDEIDKVGTDFRGDPSAALLEALDPEQNNQFSDHYLEVPFDLSEVMFITTANMLDTIPPALLDRLEVIRFSGYTYDEKFFIAKKFLVNKTLEVNGLKSTQISLPDEVLKTVIHSYTREAGVRNLEREISKVMRRGAKRIAQNKIKKVLVDKKNLDDFLGPRKFTATLAEEKDEVGVATGLAWTQAGGEILFIEVALMPGRGNLILTGHLGEVMKESCRAALSYIRSHWQELKTNKEEIKKLDIHVHVPEGAVPKDGPSAGTAITTALASALTKRKVRREVGMTGEITLRGRVLEIGGLKEKVIAAHQAGLKEIILPKDNEKDLVEVPEKIRKAFKFHYVATLSEVLQIALK